MLRGVRPLAFVGVFALVVVASASAAWGGADPRTNTPLTLLPYSCTTDPTAKPCIDAGVWYLDKARAKVGLPPYALPADFASMAPVRQMFILANLDRIAYGVAPIPGLTGTLSHDALVHGVWRADDPYPSSTAGLNVWWPGWAGAFFNTPMAYETFVWNDGLGSTNPRCTPTDHSRCWGHRHSVLWRYGSNAAMGAAAGFDPSHHRGYSYLFVGGSSSFHPTFTYTWQQAVADGAGSNVYDPGLAPSQMCRVPIVIGDRLAGATTALEQAHCAVGSILYVHSNYVRGLVTNQHPTWGANRWTYPPGRRVALTISLGPR